MKITEKQLRSIIRNIISEAIDPAVAKNAQMYINQNNKGGFTTNQMYDGLGGSLRQMFGARKDSNGQMDWQNSANEIQNTIGAYTNEVRRLTRVYNAITGHQAQGWSDERKAKAAQTRAFNQNWKAQNGQTGPRWQNRAVGSGPDLGSKFAGKSRGRATDVVDQTAQNLAAGGHTNLRKGLEEGWFNRNQQPDEVDQICQNWKSYVGNTDAAQKVSAKIQEYKGMIQQLKAILAKGREGGHIVDTQAQQRAAMRAARKNAGTGAPSTTYAPTGTGTLEESVERAVARAIRAVLNENR